MPPNVRLLSISRWLLVRFNAVTDGELLSEGLPKRGVHRRVARQVRRSAAIREPGPVIDVRRGEQSLWESRIETRTKRMVLVVVEQRVIAAS